MICKYSREIDITLCSLFPYVQFLLRSDEWMNVKIGVSTAFAASIESDLWTSTREYTFTKRLVLY